MTAPLTGYADRVSVRSGERIAFKVSSAGPGPYHAMLVRVMLEKGGHKVRHVEDFETLLDCALYEASARPDIIISDLSMPGGNGIDMLGRLRRKLPADARVEPHPVPLADARLIAVFSRAGLPA